MRKFFFKSVAVVCLMICCMSGCSSSGSPSSASTVGNPEDAGTLGTNGISVTTGASTNPIVDGNQIIAASCSYADVQKAILLAKSGDTVIVPAGSCAWDKTLNISKGIYLKGAGSGLTIVKNVINEVSQDAGVLLRYDPLDSNTTFSLSGFTFDGNNSSMSHSGIITVINSSASGYINLIVKNNTIKNIGGSGRGLCLDGSIYGVAAQNIFDRVAIVLGTYGNDYLSWANQTQAYGSAKNFYFEDNSIIFSSSFPAGYSGWTESGQGGRVVVRYNTWDYTNATEPGEFWDVHGLQFPLVSNATTGCLNYSTMVAEYYGNKIINQVGAYRWMAHRGGWLMMFNNSLTGTTSPYNGVTEYFCNSCQANGSFNQKVTNSYYWRNLANGNEEPATVYSPGAAPYGCASDPISENVDFFNYKVAFDGSSGVGCGTLSQRPQTCTPGVGYWATNQSCSDLTEMVGANPSTPISGTLYKCTAPNTWTAYYTPYTYPHPLR